MESRLGGRALFGARRSDLRYSTVASREVLLVQQRRAVPRATNPLIVSAPASSADHGLYDFHLLYREIDGERNMFHSGSNVNLARRNPDSRTIGGFTLRRLAIEAGMVGAKGSEDRNKSVTHIVTFHNPGQDLRQDWLLRR